MRQRWHSPNPAFTRGLFFLHDVGVVLLLQGREALRRPSNGQVPAQDQLDGLEPRQRPTFNRGGVGLSQINCRVARPCRSASACFAEPHLIQINGGDRGRFSLLLSNMPPPAHLLRLLGCGPDYLGPATVIAGVTSFGAQPAIAPDRGRVPHGSEDGWTSVGQFLK